MSRSSFGGTMRAIARAAAQAERARTLEAKRQETERRRQERESERRSKLDAKEAARQYVESRINEVDDLNRDLAQRDAAINGLLTTALSSDPTFDLSSLKSQFVPKKFDTAKWHRVEPRLDAYVPAAQGFFARLVPGAKARHDRKIALATQEYNKAKASYDVFALARTVASRDFNEAEEQRKLDIDQTNLRADKLCMALESGDRDAVIQYVDHLIKKNLSGEPDAISAAAGYARESKHLVLDVELPDLSVIPEQAAFKYVKSSDRIDVTLRPMGKRRTAYAGLICQISLKCIDMIFRGCPPGLVE